MNIQEIIKQQIENNPVILYMKGTPDFPQCGFSARAVQLLKAVGITDFFSVNVLDNMEIREGVKEFSQWPTIPQLYVKGEFIGGCDIMTELFQNGDLSKLFAE